MVFTLIMGCFNNAPAINLNDYPTNTYDYGTLTQYEQIVFDKILLSAKVGRDTVEYKEEINRHRILTHLGLYYGSMETINETIGWGDGYMELHLDKFEELESNKIIIETRVDEALKNIKEGSDRYKLRQIAKYLANRIKYTDGVRETIDGLNGEGVCVTYSMLFYKMVTRLGIQCYICSGYIPIFDEHHAWNMVELDGVKYFYDINGFDNEYVYNYIYLYNKNSWGRKYELNNAW